MGSYFQFVRFLHVLYCDLNPDTSNVSVCACVDKIFVVFAERRVTLIEFQWTPVLKSSLFLAGLQIHSLPGLLRGKSIVLNIDMIA